MRVLVSPQVDSSAVMDILRLSLLLPVGIPQGFNEVETRLILLYEFTHFRSSQSSGASQARGSGKSGEADDGRRCLD